MTERHPLWEQRLHEFVAKNLNRPHVYGEFDCLLMPAGAATAVTGHDHARGHRRKYKSHATAHRYLKTKFGVDRPEQLLDKLFPLKAVGFAQRGDFVLCAVDVMVETGQAGEVVGLCMGSFALVPAADGLQRVPRGERWLKAWAVGDHHSGEDAHG